MLKKSAVFMSFSTLFLFAVDGKALMKEKCATCHMTETPTYEQMGTFSAPPFDAVAFHLKDAIQGKEAQKAFILDYVMNPSASKSVCESNKVAKYGVMPSMKGKVSQEELSAIADYLLETYPHERFVRLIKEMLTNDKLRALQNSPFLINRENLPHFTKLLIQNWDKAKLGLSAEQKQKLLKIRQDTLRAVKAIQFKLQALEEEVAEAMIDREDPKSVEKQLEEIAKLKLEATRVHLKCISETTAVLTDEQIEVLLPIWE
jgi:mono/diheme cytochrome c family protein/Spy/CpxP family protein refolding chaperone